MQENILTFNTEDLVKSEIAPKGISPKFLLVKEDDPILKRKVDKFDFNNPEIDPIDLSEILIDNLKHYNGFGLSANQLGLPYNCFVAGVENNYVAFFNCEIIEESSEKVALAEGCLSFPALFVNIKRPKTITVKYQDFYGVEHIKEFSGITARIIQHESDHMNGIIFYEKAGKMSKIQAFKNREKVNRNIRKIKKGNYKL